MRKVISLLLAVLLFWTVDAQYFDYNKKSTVISHLKQTQAVEDFAPVKLPFEFKFGDKSYSQIYILSNGWLTFDKIEKKVYSPDIVRLKTFIAPFYTLKDKNKFYKVKVQKDKDFIAIEWINTNTSEFFQTILYKTGEITFQYSVSNYDDNILIALVNEKSAITNKLEYWNGTGRELSQIAPNFSLVNIFDFQPITEPRNYLGHLESNTSCHTNNSQDFTHVLNPLVNAPKNVITIGNGTNTTTIETPYRGYWQDARMQFIITASELSAAGLNGGDIITALGFNVSSVNSTQPYTGFTIRLAHTSQNSFSSASWLSTTWTTVYQADYTPTTGWNTHNFSTNFTWNGTDNLAVEVCFDNNSYTSSDAIYYTQTSSNTVCYAEQDNSTGCTLSAESTSDYRPNVQITYTPGAPCTEPSDQATNLNLTAADAFTVNGSFTAAASNPDGYLVVRSTSSSLTADPVDGTKYNPGDPLGGGVVVYSGSSTSFTDNCLDPEHIYYYFIYDYDDYCSGAPDYNTNNPLTGNVTTLSFNQPTNLNLTAGPNQIDGTFDDANPAVDGYLVIKSYNSTLSSNPVDGTSYNPGDNIGGGEVVQMSNATNFSVSCLPPGTTLYFFIYSYRNSCSGDPIYSTATPLTGHATTPTDAADYTLPYSQYFDNPIGWTTTGVWEIGDQTDDNYGPPSGVSGSSVAGTKLNANYDVNNASDYLTSPTFSLEGVPRPIISFWMDMESENSYDGGTVQIQVNGCDWITINKDDPGYSGLVPNDADVSGINNNPGWSGTQPDGEWAQVKIDLKALTTPGLDNISENDIIRVRFWFGSDGSVSSYPGWYIDNFKIDDLDPCQEPVCATDLHLTPGTNSIKGIFSPADPEPTGYLVIRSTNSSLSANPENGTTYNVGDNIGGGTVIQISNDFQFTDNGLAQNTTYYYFIYSYNNTDCSGPVYSSCVLTGNATTLDCSSLTVPWAENFDNVSTPDLPDCWTIEDNSAPNDDWESYGYGARSSPNCMHISWDSSDPLDDWAFSPGIQLQAGHNYRLTFYYKAASSSYTEKLEVKMGTSNNSGAMTTQLFNDDNMTNTSYQLAICDFNVSSDGTYYFGWHAYSDADQLGIYIDDINLIDLDAPIDIYLVNDNYVFKDRGKRVTVYGEGLGGVNSADFGGYTCSIVSTTADQAVIDIPPGDYANNTLTISNGTSTGTTTLTIKTRNIIPVKAGSDPTSDDHPTISSAVNGLYAWWGTNTFDTTKVIEVYTGTYNETVSINPNLSPTSTNRLKIRAKIGEQPTVLGGTYGFYVPTDYTDIIGFTVKYGQQANIYVTGNNDTIAYNRCVKSENAGIYAEGTVAIEHNLLYDNINYGIHLKNVSNVEINSNTIASCGHYMGGTGYTLTEDRPTDGSIYNWEYNSSWTQIPFPDDDDYNIELPFDFEFYGRLFHAGDSIAPSSNGHIMMLGDIYGPGTGTSNSLDYINHPLSWHGTNHGATKVLGNDYFIAGLYDDHYDDGHGGDVRYTVRGTAPYRRLIVVWHDREHWNYGDGTDNGVSFEIKLFETTNVIEFHYNDLSYGNPDSLNYGKSATIGIKKNDSVYMQYSFNTEILPHSDVPFALRYSPNPPGGTQTFLENCSNITLKNNIFYSLQGDGTDKFYALATNTTNAIVNSDYNIYFSNNNAYLLNIAGVKYSSLSSWSGAGAHDIEADPMFVDPENKDFHIKSTATGASFHNGEWPPLTAGKGTWITDSASTTPALDAGNGEYIWEQEDNGDARNIGCYGNTLQATKTNILQGYWTGAVSTEWDNPNNWSDNIVPDKTKDAIIPDVSSTTNRFPYITVNASCKDMQIDPGAYVIIAPDGALTVEGILKNNNGTDGLIIESDNTGDGSLISTTSGVDAKVYRYFYGTRYHYISSPITTTPVSQFNLNNFYYWDATMEWKGMGPPIDYTPWIKPDPSTNLELFRGYAYHYYTDTILFEGKLNVGSFTATLHKSATGTEQDQGWNLLGNPYPSSINWDAVVMRPDFPDKNTEMESAIYLFDDADASAEQKNYRYYVPADGTGGYYGVGTNDASKYIPVGQGFFVRALQDGVNITITDAERAHSLQDFYKQNEHDNLIRLFLTKDNREDELVLRLLPPATTNFDPKYDARKLFVDDMNQPQFCAINSDHSISAITSLPEYNDAITVPLLVRCAQGNYTFETRVQNLVDGRRLYLVDNLKNKTIELKKGTKYTFYYNGGVDSTRFVLVFNRNRAPEIIHYPQNQTVFEDKEFSISLKNIFTDPDGDNMTYTLTMQDNQQLPAWIKFDAENLKLYGIARNENVGVYLLTLTATDTYGEKQSATFKLDVENTNDAPFITEEFGVYKLTVGDLLKIDAISEHFKDIDPQDNLTITVENLPQWLSFENNTIEGYAQQAGEYTLIIKATDQQGASVSTQLKVIVEAPTYIDISNTDIVSVSPNPTTGILNINLKHTNEYDVTITDMSGKIVIQEHSAGEHKTLDLRHLSAGVYKLTISTAENKYSGKIVKQ